MKVEVTIPESEPRSSLLTQLRLAISFLTILPVIDGRPASEDAVARSFGAFPLVGLAIGFALVGEDWLLAHLLGQVIRSVLLVASLVVVTGGIHLDGLADTADALGAGCDRDRALEILRDSRVGTFGATAIFFDLTLKILALSTLVGSRRYLALVFAPMLARWAMPLVSAGLPYLRSSGAGSTLLKKGSLGSPSISIVSLLFVTLLWGVRPLALGIVIAAAIVLAMRLFYWRWLGGVTGDLIGACGELVEIAILVTMAS